MKPYRTKILGDEFSVFSSLDAEAFDLNEKNTVIIYPSQCCDFKISACDLDKSVFADVLAPTVAATLFLTEKRGLPLTEFSYETPCGNVDVFYTGRGVFYIKPQKYKLLFTKTETVKGCEITYRDIELGRSFRAVSTMNTDGVSSDVLSLFLHFGRELPCAVIASSYNGHEVTKACYSDFSKSSLSDLLISAVAAYNEYLNGKGRVKDFLISGEKLAVAFENGCIKVILN